MASRRTVAALKLCALAAVVAASVLWPRPGPAEAADGVVTINITALVALVDDPDNVLGGTINVGDTITAIYTYDSTTPDSNPLPTVGDYRHSSPPYGITVNAGGFVFETDPNNVDFLVEIVNDHGGPARDNYLLRSYNNLPLSNGALVEHISWQLDDPTATALSSEALPKVPPVLADWESIFGLVLRLDGIGVPFGPEYFIRAHVTSADLVTPVGGLVVDLDQPGLLLEQAASNGHVGVLAGSAAAAAVAGALAIGGVAWYARRGLR